MQNEPNLKPPIHFATPHGPRITTDESRLNMQNKPNLQKNEHKYGISRGLWKCSTLRMTQIYQTNRRLCRPQPPIYAIRHTRYEIIYAKQTQSVEYQETNYAKRTQFQSKFAIQTNNLLQKMQKMQRNAKKYALFPIFGPRHT